MKKLKLNLQSLNAEVLTRSQLKQILGGDGGSGGGTVNYGSCLGYPAGCWTYTSGATWQECENDIDIYCGSVGGTCSIDYVCY